MLSYMLFLLHLAPPCFWAHSGVSSVPKDAFAQRYAGSGLIPGSADLW